MPLRRSWSKQHFVYFIVVEGLSLNKHFSSYTFETMADAAKEKLAQLRTKLDQIPALQQAEV